MSVFVGAYLISRGGRRRTAGRLLVVFALITAALLADDFWVLHENLGERWPLGERPFVAAYGLASVAAAFAFRRTIRRTRYALLLAAFGCFAGSVAVDEVADFDRLGHWAFLIEDGLKFLGIVGWTGYFAETSLDQLARTEAEPGA